MVRTVPKLLALLLGLGPTCALALPAPAAAPPAAYADPKAVIVAAHRKIDDDLKAALMSPFTAVEAHYLETGASLRLGSDGTVLSFDPAKPKPMMGLVSYDGAAFWVAPAGGSTAPVVRKTKESGLDPAPGKPVAAKVKVGEGEVIAFDRFLLDMSPQSGKGRLMAYDPESPTRKSFTGLKWFEPRLELQVPATFHPDAAPAKITVGTSRGLKKEFFRAGTFEFEIGGAPQKLAVLAGSAEPKEGEDLFVPFRDATTGKESYEVGRYLNMKFKAPGASYIIDFNDAGNPNCNYSPYYNCPIPPAENTLSVPIRAGEMTYPAHH